jgi:hypothetical protein
MGIFSWLANKLSNPLGKEAPAESQQTKELAEAPLYKNGECGSPFLRWIVAQWVSKGPDGVGEYKADLDDLVAFTEFQAGDELLPRPTVSESALWTPVERNLVKAYLESSSKDGLTLPDWLLVIDYLYQRYCPEQVAQADAEMVATRQKVRERVTNNYVEMEEARTKGPSPLIQKRFEEQSTKHQAEQNLLRTGIPLSKDDFKSIIIPILKGYNNSFKDYSETDIAMLYDYGNSVYAVHSVAKDYFISHNRGESLAVSAALLKNSYEKLSAAASLGRFVKILVPQGHNCCLSIFHECHVTASDLLSAYSNPAGRFPIFPPYETPCFKNECCYGACPIRFLDLWEGAAPGPKIPPDWRKLLTDNWQAMLREQMEDQIEDLKESIPDHIQDLSDEETFIERPPEAGELSCRPIVELRALQRKCGIKGLRSKADIAEQLTSHPVHDEIFKAVRKLREDKIEWLKGSIESDKEELLKLENLLASHATHQLAETI